MHHSLIKFETAHKMFANFLASKVTKFENFYKMKLYQDQTSLRHLGHIV